MMGPVAEWIADVLTDGALTRARLQRDDALRHEQKALNSVEHWRESALAAEAENARLRAEIEAMSVSDRDDW